MIVGQGETYEEMREKIIRGNIEYLQGQLNAMQEEYRKITGRDYRVSPKFVSEAARREL